MNPTFLTNLITIVAIVLFIITIVIFVLRLGVQKKDAEIAKKEANASREETLRAIQTGINDLRSEMAHNSAELRAEIGQKLTEQNLQNEQKLENIRNTMEKRMTGMQEENSRQLDKMRETVDEKLQSTLEKRISESFKLVSERLEKVSEGLGEMQNLATGVGDLKKVLSNVKARGTLGEIQLEAILEEILAPEQYEKDIETVKGSGKRVEFAIKLPGNDDKSVYLPIDAKFHADAYSNLQDAYELGEKESIELARKELVTRIKNSAKDIKTKYISPPETTDFAIMFLPFEGLYSEVVHMGLVEILQRDYKISIAGPTTTAALLNSLQMGFRTLAIQKRSGEVWEVLGAVKTEFDTFNKVLLNAQRRIKLADDELAKLIGTRTNQINRKLRGVSSLSESLSKNILETDNFDSFDEDLITEEEG